MPDMEFVESSNLEQIGYDADQMELHVVFKGGDTYIYSAVPEHVFDQLRDAPSKGSFLNREVRYTFEYRKA